MLMTALVSCLLLLGARAASSATSADPSSIASKYSLTTSTSLPFPSATLASSAAQSFIASSWSLSKGHVQDGGSDLAFVADPFANSSGSTSPASASNASVLQVTYPSGSYSHDTGGAQFYTLWNSSNASTTYFHSVLLTYEVAFGSEFDWVKGGKLPGLRGGPDVYGCSGGKPTNGSDCFSARAMWRTDGEGEVYAYFLESKDLCADSNFLCNSDGYGTSVDRGSFGFAVGQWNRISLLVRLNDPPEKANGQVALYYNDVEALNEENLQYRNSTDINIGGLFFSTFFGGNDSAWATPRTVHTYFRNFEMWGSEKASVLT
ncbi:polysaccharide lyase family 14 protein, partial [Laetiporus sulphureus 93-53]